MGFESTGANILFLNVSCGKLVNKKKEISEQAYTGVLIDITQENDEFEGKEIPKIKLKMIDNKSDDVVSISFSEESWFGTTFFQRIDQVDVSKPFTLGVLGSDKNEKVSFCYIRQGDLIKKDETYPIQKKVTVGRNEIMDFSECLEMNLKIIELVKKKIAAADPLRVEPPSHKPGGITPNKKADTDEPDINEYPKIDKLPF
ncbi:MAG TPA: hypothetical protein PLU58_07340 [Saprospiraceae bacterium]|nr:hypothetical protein [Saprospiraceae bacterium]